MAADLPLVSVIMCVLNGEEFLPTALDSVEAQTYPNIEILFVDDGSSDGTAALARAAGERMHYVYQENAGVPSARNVGLEMASGAYITFLDADDWWSPTKTEIQVNLLQDGDRDIVLGHTRRTWSAPAGTAETDPELALSLCAALIDRPVFDRIGPFDESLRFCDDWDWFMRARERGLRVEPHPETVLYYRRHGSNLTNDMAASNRDFARILKASLDRRRRAGQMHLERPRQVEEQP